MNTVRLLPILTGQNRSPSARLLRLPLILASLPYSAIVRLRNLAFNLHLKKTRHLPKPVISVGNITAGGTGKTPFVIHLTHLLQQLSAHPAILLRGYKPRSARDSSSLSDEAQLLRNTLGPSVPVETGPNRFASALRVLQQHPQTSIFILDDGFQHRQLHRDLDLLLLDAPLPFAGHHLLPAGLLREPLSSLSRSHAIILSRANLVSPADIQSIQHTLSSILPPSHPGIIAHTSSHWPHLLDANNQIIPLSPWQNRPVAAVAAIGNPFQFHQMLRQHFPQLLHFHTLPDHHPYSPSLLNQLLSSAHQKGAQTLLMTEKDWVKCLPLLPSLAQPLPIPIHRLPLTLSITQGQDRLSSLLQHTLSSFIPPSFPH